MGNNWKWIDPEGINTADCYICEEEIPAKATNWSFTWGSDGALYYACVPTYKKAYV